MLVKAEELKDDALDWAVAQAEKEVVVFSRGALRYPPGQFSDEERYWPTSDPSQGHAIIEREGITTRRVKDVWYAMSEKHSGTGELVRWNECAWSMTERDVRIRLRYDGPTMLIAAFRCHVANKLGPVIDVPDELVRKPVAKAQP